MKTYSGVSELIDGISDAVSNRLASTDCTHGVHCNKFCPECQADLDDQLQGEQDSLAAAEESFSRINP